MNGFLYIFTGDDDFLVNEAVKDCLDHHLSAEEREFGLEIIHGDVTTGGDAAACVDKVLNSIQTPSFLGDKKLTWLQNASFLPGGGQVAEYNESKEAVAKFESFLAKGLQEWQIMIISAAKIRSNSTFFKCCAQSAKIEDFGSGVTGWKLEQAAERYLDRFIEKGKIKMGAAARKEFLQRVGCDTRTMVSEFEKLTLYAAEKNEITSADVCEIVSVGRESQAWDVLDAFGTRNPVKLIESIERVSGQSGIAIMLCAMLDKNIRTMLVLREAFDKGWIKSNASWADNMAKDVELMLKNLPGKYMSSAKWQLEKSLKHALNFTVYELRVARYRIIELREKLVSTSQPEIFLLQTALLRIIQSPRQLADSSKRRR